jgi:hypothetical protein
MGLTWTARLVDQLPNPELASFGLFLIEEV